MIKNMMALGLLMVAAGCGTAKDTGDTGSTPVGDGGDGGGGGDLVVDVSWGSSSVSLAITNGSGSYLFGMAETGASCSDNPSWCWTGEDCQWGYYVDDSTTHQYCETASATGVSLTYGGDLENLQTGTTVFTAATADNGTAYADSVTYYLEDSDSNCYTWGDLPSYYDGLGCQ